MDINILIILRGMYKAITMDNSNCRQVLTLVVMSLANSQIGYSDLLLIQSKLIIHDFSDMFKPMSFFLYELLQHLLDLQAAFYQKAECLECNDAYLKYNMVIGKMRVKLIGIANPHSSPSILTSILSKHSYLSLI